MRLLRLNLYLFSFLPYLSRRIHSILLIKLRNPAQQTTHGTKRAKNETKLEKVNNNNKNGQHKWSQCSMSTHATRTGKESMRYFAMNELLTQCNGLSNATIIIICSWKMHVHERSSRHISKVSRENNKQPTKHFCFSLLSYLLCLLERSLLWFACCLAYCDYDAARWFWPLIIFPSVFNRIAHLFAIYGDFVVYSLPFFPSAAATYNFSIQFCAQLNCSENIWRASAIMNLSQFMSCTLHATHCTPLHYICLRRGYLLQCFVHIPCALFLSYLYPSSTRCTIYSQA